MAFLPTDFSDDFCHFYDIHRDIICLMRIYFAIPADFMIFGAFLSAFLALFLGGAFRIMAFLRFLRAAFLQLFLRF